MKAYCVRIGREGFGGEVYILADDGATGKEEVIKEAVRRILHLAMPKDVLWITPKQRAAYENATISTIEIIDIRKDITKEVRRWDGNQ